MGILTILGVSTVVYFLGLIIAFNIASFTLKVIVIVILSIVFTVICTWTIVDYPIILRNKRHEEIKKSFNAVAIEEDAYHIGGLPSTGNEKCFLIAKEDELIINTLSRSFNIKYEQIYNTIIDYQKGVIASTTEFSLKNSYGQTVYHQGVTNVYYKVNCILNGRDITITFQCSAISFITEVEREVNRRLSRYNENINMNIDKNEEIEIPTSDNKDIHISVADELKKFAELRDNGIISQEEFEKEKNKLLNN